MPTKVGRKGDLNPSGRPKPRPFNGWWCEAPEELLDDRIGHPLALDHMLERLRGRADRFAMLREQLSQRMFLFTGASTSRPATNAAFGSPRSRCGCLPSAASAGV